MADISDYIDNQFLGGGDAASGFVNVPPQGTLDQGSQASAGGGAPNVPAPGNDANQIQGWYQKFLGRSASDAEIQSHLGNPGGLGAVMNVIANSPEADAYNKANKLGNYAVLPGNQPAPAPAPAPTGTNNGGFADPAYQSLLNLVNQRLGQLQTPPSFPQLDQLTSMLTANEAQAKQRAQTFADQLSGRIGQLQQPLLSDANVVQQRALASNATLGQRDAMLANSRDALAARGIDPRTSGLATNEADKINQNYSNAQAQIDAQLQQGNIATDEQRRNEATTLQQLSMQALNGGDTTALANQAQNAELESQLFNLNENRANQTLAVGQIPVDLTNQGFTNSITAANSANASNPLMAILSLASLANQQQGIQQAGSNSNASTLAWLFQTLLNH